MVSFVAIQTTKAYFSGQVLSANNTYSTGTLTLEVNSQHPTASAIFAETNLAPGQVLSERQFVVRNTGSLNGHHLDLTVTLTGDTQLAQYLVFSGNTDGLRFGTAKAGTSSVRLDVPGWTAGDPEYGIFQGDTGDYLFGPQAVAPLVTGPGNGMDRDNDAKVTLADLAVGPIRIVPGTVSGGINALTDATLWLNMSVDPQMGDALQGKSLSATFTWTLHQDASQ